MGDKALMNTYGEKAMTLVSGEGCLAVRSKRVTNIWTRYLVLRFAA
jgi:hypothetical protein